MTREIKFFNKDEPYYEFSNFSPFGFHDGDFFWPTVEHYFQAQKFLNTDQYERIKNASSAKQAKALGQDKKLPLPTNWEVIKEGVMYFALKKKFENPLLKALLLKTGKKILIENSPYDKYWGCGKDGKGKNRLGILLMKLRDELK